MKRLDLEKIDLSTHEGRLLQAALVELTTTIHKNMTPYQVISYLYEIANRNEPESEFRKRERNNVYAQIERLANCIMKEAPLAIRDGGAVDNAIALIRKAYGNFFGNGGESIPAGRFDNDRGAVCKSPKESFMTMVDQAEHKDYDAGLKISSEVANASEVILKHADPEMYKGLSELLVLNYRKLMRANMKRIS